MYRLVGSRPTQVVSFGAASTAPTIVGVGGWIGTWDLWLQPLELLAGRFAVAAYDHPGTGDVRVGPEHLTFESQVDALFEVMDALALERCVLAGDSNGAVVAAAAALRQPGRVAGLALVSGGFGSADQKPVHDFVAGLRSDPAAVLDFFADLCIRPHEGDHLKRWLRSILGRADPEAAAALLEGMYGVDLLPQLGAIDVPTVVVHGADDPFPTSPVAQAEAVAAAIPGARMVRIGGGGHVLTFTHPAEVAAAIEELMACL